MATKKLQILGSLAGSSTTVDETLTQSGSAADAKVVGDIVGNKEELTTSNKDSLVGAINEVADEVNVLSASTDDNGKFLRVVDGLATWSAVDNAEEVGF